MLRNELSKGVGSKFLDDDSGFSNESVDSSQSSINCQKIKKSDMKIQSSILVVAAPMSNSSSKPTYLAKKTKNVVPHRGLPASSQSSSILVGQGTRHYFRGESGPQVKRNYGASSGRNEKKKNSTPLGQSSGTIDFDSQKPAKRRSMTKFSKYPNKKSFARPTTTIKYQDLRSFAVLPSDESAQELPDDASSATTKQITFSGVASSASG